MKFKYKLWKNIFCLGYFKLGLYVLLHNKPSQGFLEERKDSTLDCDE